jgi:hypothetical protein
MWNTQQNNENAVIKSLVERLEKVERKLNEISKEVKEPKSEFKYLDVINASKFLGMSRAKLYILSLKFVCKQAFYFGKSILALVPLRFIDTFCGSLFFGCIAPFEFSSHFTQVGFHGYQKSTTGSNRDRIEADNRFTDFL